VATGVRFVTWEPVIGLEVHVQLATASKAFSSSAIAFGAPPNSLVDPVVLGLPGALPVFNRRAAELAVRLGVATRSRIRTRSRFARKHYFYPDLPKGYQISQFDEPLCEDGVIDVISGDRVIAVALQRIHLEEDAGKNMHHGAVSHVDLNRAGVPLVEVVTAPCLGSADDAAELMRSLHRLVRWLEISEADMEKGQMRCDANVSIRPAGSSELGTRTELKNINSFRFVQRAIEHEIARQIRIADAGGSVHRETRLWDAARESSFPLRSKEEANDYRYFPDPDLPPLQLDDDIGAIANALPELPHARWQRLRDLGLTADDARQLVGDRASGDYFDAVVAALGVEHARLAAAWINGELAAALNRDRGELATSPLAPGGLAELLALIADGTISGKIAKDLFDRVYAGESAAAIVDREGLRQIGDADQLRAVAAEIVAANPNQAAQYRGGKAGLLGFFVGQLMKATGGRANPQLAAEILRELLGSGSDS
jgi:aspartyl-tRNA(Asn)/glutamyl-tRNA(Gln) amidotransferase subunit B